MSATQRNADFFERLYRGFEAEQLIAGRLFAAGLEAFKLPGDFGFDLLVSNSRELTLGPKPAMQRGLPFPYLVQVKSWRPLASDPVQTATGRSEIRAFLHLRPHEFELFESEPASHLAFVIFFPKSRTSVSGQCVAFWLCSHQLMMLKKHSYFETVQWHGKSSLRMTIGARFQPTLNAHELVQEMFSSGEISPAASERLIANLPKRTLKNYKSSDYLALYRSAFSTNDKRYTGMPSVAKQLNSSQLDFRSICTTNTFPTNDNCEQFPVDG